MSEARPALLEIEGLHTAYAIRGGLLRRPVGWIHAVHDVSLSIEAGETVAVVGESGCGKSTLGHSVLRLVEPRAGAVRFRGTDLLPLDARTMRPFRRRLQIVFQDSLAALDPRMRAGQAIAEGMRSFGIGSGEADRERRVAELLERVQLDPAFASRYPHELSGGQRQRVAIARAFAVEPELVVLDEAVSALDVSIQAQILNLLRRLQRELGIAYLFITHDLGVVRYLADRVVVMYLGQVVEEASTERLFENPRHPYTRGLLAAIPSVDPAQRRLEPAVPGDLPSPSAPPPGCRFHTRCPEVMARCRSEAPPLVASDVHGSTSRCFLTDPDDARE